MFSVSDRQNLNFKRPKMFVDAAEDYIKVVLIKLKSNILEFAKFSKYFLQNAGEQVLLKLDYWQIDINCGINTPPLTRFRCSSSNLSKCERRMRLV